MLAQLFGPTAEETEDTAMEGNFMILDKISSTSLFVQESKKALPEKGEDSACKK